MSSFLSDLLYPQAAVIPGPGKVSHIVAALRNRRSPEMRAEAVQGAQQLKDFFTDPSRDSPAAHQLRRALVHPLDVLRGVPELRPEEMIGLHSAPQPAAASLQEAQARDAQAQAQADFLNRARALKAAPGQPVPLEPVPEETPVALQPLQEPPEVTHDPGGLLSALGIGASR